MNVKETEFAEKFKIYRYDGDCFGGVKPGAMLRYAQQIAGEHAAALGLTDEVYTRTHTAHVLAKLALHFDRCPHVDEELTLITKPERLKRAVNKRVTDFFDVTGTQVAQVDSRWVVIDTDKRMILRTHPAEYATANWAAEVPEELPMRMQKRPLEETTVLGERTADYSLCDMNGHLNNTRYADILCNALPWTVWENNTLQDLLLFYHKEVPHGESFTLHAARLSENQWYFAGVREGKACFEANMTFRPRG